MQGGEAPQQGPANDGSRNPLLKHLISKLVPHQAFNPAPTRLYLILRIQVVEMELIGRHEDVTRGILAKKVVEQVKSQDRIGY